MHYDMQCRRNKETSWGPVINLAIAVHYTKKKKKKARKTLQCHVCRYCKKQNNKIILIVIVIIITITITITITNKQKKGKNCTWRQTHTIVILVTDFLIIIIVLNQRQLRNTGKRITSNITAYNFTFSLIVDSFMIGPLYLPVMSF